MKIWIFINIHDLHYSVNEISSNVFYNDTNILVADCIVRNRKEKYVTVMHQGNITYDYLILTCGMQYQRPQFQDELDEQKKG